MPVTRNQVMRALTLAKLIFASSVSISGDPCLIAPCAIGLSSAALNTKACWPDAEALITCNLVYNKGVGHGIQGRVTARLQLGSPEPTWSAPSKPHHRHHGRPKGRFLRGPARSNAARRRRPDSRGRTRPGSPAGAASHAARGSGAIIGAFLSGCGAGCPSPRQCFLYASAETQQFSQRVRVGYIQAHAG